jgi:hypothetical protein
MHQIRTLVEWPYELATKLSHMLKSEYDKISYRVLLKPKFTDLTTASCVFFLLCTPGVVVWA